VPIEPPALHIFTVVVDEHVARDGLRASLAGRGIQTTVHYPPIHRFSIYEDGAPDLPLTEAYSGRAITPSLFAGMTEAQQDLVIDALRDGSARSPPGVRRIRRHTSACACRPVS
jgi:dTDP-4-amino-4,6-dideoxygalactose transaminase